MLSEKLKYGPKGVQSERWLYPFSDIMYKSGVDEMLPMTNEEMGTCYVVRNKFELWRELKALEDEDALLI